MSTDVTAPTVAPKVEVGPTTIAGYGATAVGMIAFVLVLVLKVDEEQATIIATAAFTVVSFVVTQVGRYAQARELAKKAPVIAALPASAPAPRNMQGPIMGQTIASAGDPDHPLREQPLSDEEIRGIVGDETVEDPHTDPPPQIH